jgi:prolyl oligopeptidase
MTGGRLLLLFLALLLLVAAAIAAEDGSSPTAAPVGPPKAKVQPVEETLHGQKIADPYRWMENPASPETQEYVREEMAYTRSLLDPLPGRGQIESRLLEMASLGTIGTPQPAGNYYFYTRRDGQQNQPKLLVRSGIKGADRILVDANALSTDGTVALDWWYPSEDGKYVAYGLSSNGSEDSVLHLVETASGKALPDAIERTRFASLAWKKDNSGFFYTRHPKKGEVPPGQEVYFSRVFYHALGSDPANDPLIFGEGRDPQDMMSVTLADDTDRWLLITVSVGWSKSELFLQDLQAGTPPAELTKGLEFLYYGEILKDKLYIHSNEESSRYRVFRADLPNARRENWKEIIPQGDAVLQNIAIFDNKLLGRFEKNASSLLRAFDLEGKPLREVALPAIGTVSALGGRWDRKEVFFGFNSFTVPPSVYQADLDRGDTSLWDKINAPIDPGKYEVKQLWYRSKDGTRVPMFVFHKKGFKLDGKNPTLLNGYGGFNISMTPAFVGGRFVWLDHGGVFAVANLRGGAEFGEDWHRAGMLDKKQNVFDDFIAAAEFLISEKYTDKDHLAIQGGSNGGLLTGVVMTQRPELFRAVVCQVPLLDMLRYQNFQIAKLWIPEYGSAENPDQFRWIYAYSPYQHVKAGTQYPAVLFMTADTDTRVDPMHAKKMAALMQAEAGNGQSRERPILLRIETKAGHGAGKPIVKQIAEGVDIYSFLFWQLGVKP